MTDPRLPRPSDATDGDDTQPGLVRPPATPATGPAVAAAEPTPPTGPAVAPTEPSPPNEPTAEVTDRHQAGRRLLGATAIMASGTMVSRVLGFVRAIMLAFVLGNGTRQVEMFGTATLIPNTLYMLFAGGALNTVLVPQIVRAIKNDSDGGQAFVNRIMTAFLAAMAVVAALATLATPAALTLWTNARWRSDALEAHYASLTAMAYLTMPQLFFYGAFFLIGQVLNAKDRFGPMMWAPIANNVVQIGVLGIYAYVWGTHVDTSQPFASGQVWLLGAGSTLGIVIQTLILIPFMRQTGFHYRPRWDLKGTGLGRTFHVAKWMLGYTALTMIAQTVVWNLATSAVVGGSGAGGNVYQNAYLIWILPHSLLTVSLATAMLPSASRKAAVGDLPGVEEETSHAVRLATTFLMPGCLGLLVLAEPIARLAFGHGQGADDAHYVAATLVAFAIGLVPYTIQYLYLRGFYAMEETRVPFLLQVLISGLNAGLALLLVLSWNDPTTVAPRLALSYSLAYVAGWWASHRALKRQLPTLSGGHQLRHLARVLLASLPGSALAWGIAQALARVDSFAAQALGLVAAALVALLAYFFTAKRLGVAEASQFLAVIRRRPAAATQDDAGKAPAGAPAGGADRADLLPPATGPDPGRGAVLAYPDPADGHIPAAVQVPGPGFARVGTGAVLVGRYRLDELLLERARVLTWRAFDERLSRSVLLHVLPMDDPRSDTLIELSRRASAATDSRFLRILDAGHPAPGAGHGAYVVCEYAAGSSLEQLLHDGPLTGLEAAWIARELGEALATVHPQGLVHRRLNPDTVVITAAGNVKIVGLLIEDALTPAETAPDDSPDGPECDVLALGRLLYACLVARWPGAAAYGLAAAPGEDGRVLTPGQVRAGISRPLDILTDRIVNPVPRNRQARITTAPEVAMALGAVLGQTSAAGDLERRLRTPILPFRTTPSPVAALDPTPPATGSPDDAPAGDEAWLLREVEGLDHAEPFTPVPPPPRRPDGAPPLLPPPPAPAPPPRGRPGRVLAIGGVGLVLIAALAWAAINGRGGGTPTPTGVLVKVAAVDDFDPVTDGGSGNENAKLVARAIDADAVSSWVTERYRGKPTLGGLKPGVGLVLDLGAPTRVSSVAVSLIGAGTDVELRVPEDLSLGVIPARSQKDWAVVASAAQAKDTTVLTPGAPVTTRFLLVYLTSLPPELGNYYQGGISNIEVRP